MTTVLTGLAVTRDGSNNGTTPKGLRLAIGGMLAKNGASGVDVRKGVLWDGGAPLVTGNADMTYTVRSCNAVVMPTATQGPVIVPNDAAISIATTAAPGTNSRIDIIWVRQHLVAADGGSDSDVIGEWGVTQGTAGGAPAAPTIPTGAIELARATVPSGTTGTNSLTISQTHLWTVTDGAPVPVRGTTERDAITFSGSIVNRLDTAVLQRYNGTSWIQVGGADDSGWVPCTGLASGWTTPADDEKLSVRAFGPIVELTGKMTRTATLSAGSASVSTGAIPSGYRPRCTVPAGTYGSASNPVELIVTPDGNLSIEPQNTMGGTGYVYVNMTWMRG